MQIKNAINNLQKEHPEDQLVPLYTPWGQELDTDNIWQQYPRPQMKREDYHMLNGAWDYCFTSDTQILSMETAFPADGQIIVPFSPESLLSGVGRQLQPNEFLWYQRKLMFSQKECAGKKLLRKRCILHFDAVDQEAWVYVDGKLLVHHEGGYLPFHTDITDYVSDHGCLLQVKVRDVSDTSYHTRGKQVLNRGGMFYTAQSGIWQSVWYEWVPDNHIQSQKITIDYDNAKVRIELTSDKAFQQVLCKVGAATCDTLTDYTPVPSITQVAILDQHKSTNYTTVEITFPAKDFLSWTPDTPYLYPYTIMADEDVIEGYFAMRIFTLEHLQAVQLNNRATNESQTNETSSKALDMPRFCLNHQPLFLHGILDQGYWPDGLMTAPCDDAFVYDIQLVKDFGFNMIRKHIKIEPLRWYYHCDRLGMIVWQDMVNGGTKYCMPWVCYTPTVLPWIGKHFKDTRYGLFSRKDAEGRKRWEKECMDTIEHLINVPSLAVWVPFNEAWGQFDAARIADKVKTKDPSRLVDHASGWFDQKRGDFRSVHNYFRPLKVEHDVNRAFVISEYGGYACHIKGHSSVDRVYGYQKYDTTQDLAKAYDDLLDKQLFPLVNLGLSGAVYTQLSDIEEEVNGLVTYDRKVVKIPRPQRYLSNLWDTSNTLFKCTLASSAFCKFCTLISAACEEAAVTSSVVAESCMMLSTI